MKAITIVLPRERPISWNKIYESRHWIFRKNLADSVHRKVTAAMVDMGIHPMDKTKMFQGRVDIVVTAFFDKRPLDSDNIGAKIYIDPLKLVLIMDDNPKYVRRVSSQSEIDRENPRLEIVLTPVDNNE